MMQLDGVGFRYAGATRSAIDRVSFAVPQGSIVALLGPNGAGKTTLLRLLCGRLQASEGTIRIPKDWQDPKGHLDLRQLGFLIENPGVYARLSIREYLEFFGGFYEIKDVKHRIQNLCEFLGIDSLETRLAALSLGTRQKVHLVRSLLHQPKLLLLDEPTSNLDPESRDAFWALIEETSKQQGTTVLVCSHQLAEIESKSSLMGFLHEGSLKAFGTLESIHQSLQMKSHVLIRMTDPEETLRFACENPRAEIPERITTLVAQGKKILSVQTEDSSLEEIYRRLLHVSNFQA